MHTEPLMYAEIPGLPRKSGKVRDIFDFGDRLLIVATDRISAFDWVLPNGIPEKGRILTQISRMWFDRLEAAHHLISTDLASLGLDARVDQAPLRGRSMVVRKAAVLPIECIARGYLAGSGWREYRQSQTVCGQALPAGILEAGRLPEPMFTPTTKAETGHDEPMTFEAVAGLLGSERAAELRELTLRLYGQAAGIAESVGLILADTKFEFGITDDGQLIVVDEVLTPDSSRYWPADAYEPGRNPPSFDKQFVRDWLDQSDWDKASPPPALPAEIVEQTRSKYLEAHRRLLGDDFVSAE